MMLPKNIIIIEDDIITQMYLKNILRYYNINVVRCLDNSNDILLNLELLEFDMILIDINIKGEIDVVELAKKILSKHTIPIIYLSDYMDESTLHDVLEVTPYGFILKPIQPQELYISMRIAHQQFIQHSIKLSKNIENVMINLYFKFSKKINKLYYKDKIINLTPKQNKLIQLLVKNLNITVSNEQINQVVWEDEDIAESSLRTLIYNIRKKLPQLPLKSDSKRGYYITNY